MALEPSNHTHVMDAVYIFEGCYIGLQLPVSAQGQKNLGGPAARDFRTGRARFLGGHAVPVVSYDAQGLTVVTWGQLLRMTWPFWEAYCDEAYAIISSDYLNKTKKAPNGFDLAGCKRT